MPKRKFSATTAGGASALKKKYSASTSKAIAVAVKKASQRELKGVDTDLTLAAPITTVFNTNDDMKVLNLIQQGTGYFNRIGRKVCLKSLLVHFQVSARFAANAGPPIVALPNTFRWSIVWDRQPGSVLPGWDEIFAETGEDGVEQGALLSPPRFDNMARFRIIRDKVVDVNPKIYSYQTPDETRVEMTVKDYIKLPNLETVYNSTANPMSVANIASGALYFMVRCHRGSAPADEMSLTSFSVSRLRYTD